MFVAKLRADTLKGMVNVISTLVDEVKFSISPEGISLKAVDHSHVAMVEMTIEKGAFESFEADETEIGVDLDKVKDVLKLASSSDVVSIQQDSDKGKLIFKVGNITRRMNLIDTSTMNVPRVPQLEADAMVDIPVAELQRGIKASESISDHLTLIADEKSFELLCEGDTDSANLLLESSDSVKVSASGRVASTFALDYFANLVKAVPSDLAVRIGLGTNYPLEMAFGLADGKSAVRYLLAPRIEND